MSTNWGVDQRWHIQYTAMLLGTEPPHCCRDPKHTNQQHRSKRAPAETRKAGGGRNGSEAQDSKDVTGQIDTKSQGELHQPSSPGERLQATSYLLHCSLRKAADGGNLANLYYVFGHLRGKVMKYTENQANAKMMQSKGEEHCLGMDM